MVSSCEASPSPATRTALSRFAETAIVCVGDGLIDRVHGPSSFRDYVGGCALNTAVALRRLGLEVCLSSAVGDDGSGDSIRAFLADEDVVMVGDRGQGATVVVESRFSGSEASYHWRRPVSLDDFDLGAVDRSLVEDSPAVIFSAACLTSAGDLAPVGRLVGRRKRRAVLDPNPRPALIANRREAQRRFEAVAGFFGVVKLSEADVQLLYGDGVEEVVGLVQGLGAEIVVVTRGGLGAMAFVGDDVYSQEALGLPFAAVDTMGAGDAFLAGVVSRLVGVDDWLAADWQAALLYGAAVAGCACRRVGPAQAMPPLSEVTALLRA